MNPLSILACATCMGAPGHQTTIAAGNAIVVMLWVLVAITFMVGGFVFTLVRRARRHAEVHGIPTAPDPMDQFRQSSKPDSSVR
jgi:heme/copper-type cytochrome/quinol oxidase subunit 2